MLNLIRKMKRTIESGCLLLIFVSGHFSILLPNFCHELREILFLRIRDCLGLDRGLVKYHLTKRKEGELYLHLDD